MIAPGRVFRNEEVDASHEHTFYQLEGMMIDRDVSVAHLIYFMKTLLSAIFQREVTVRLRPGYFPFVEPGFELDIQCLICGGPGCPVCKQSGWVELLPCGLVHPNVLRMSGIDPEEWNGFAFGLGLTRLVMMRYAIDDIRLLQGGDLRFLTAVLDEILIQLDSRITLPGSMRRPRTGAAHHHEDGGVRRHGRGRRAARRSVRGARGYAVEPIAGSHNVKAVVETAAYGEKTVVCGAPNCRAGHVHGLCAARQERRSTASKATACWPAARNWASTAITRGIIELDAPSGCRSPIASSRSTTSPSRTGRICGDIYGMAREVAAIVRQAAARSGEAGAAAQRAGADRGRDRRPRSMPAIQRAGVRERHGAAVAAVAAIPARRPSG